MRPSPPPRLAAGVIAATVFGVTVTALTFHQRSYLHRSGWSSVHRSPVEWPSILALGPDGWLFSFVLVVVAVLLLFLAVELRRTIPTDRVTPWAVAIAAPATAIEGELYDEVARRRPRTRPSPAS